MGRQGRESLAMETTESQNISFRREKGCFLSTFTIFFLIVAFIVAVVATGVLVYFFTDKPHSTASKEQIVYDIVPQDEASTSNSVPGRDVGTDDDTNHHHHHDHHDQNHDHSDDHSEMMDEGKDMMGEDSEAVKKVMDVRLPRSVNPLHYYVRLRPFINTNFSLDGHVEMTFEVLEPTMNVTLHIKDIKTKNETVKVVPEKDMEGTGIGIKAHIYDHEREFYVADLKQSLEKGKRYVIMMDFEGYLNKDMDGFYRSSYKDDNGTTRWLAATQFQPTDARKAFPCMDEPEFKASFTIELGREGGMSSISNMPLAETVEMEGNPGWFWDKFKKSVKMSTYLVAFVVSDFEYLESKDKMDYKFRVWARKSALSQAEYAMKVGPPASRFFENFFDVPFPLPKQDMIALPDFSAGAMENWGLITYRETAMLYDPRSTTARSKLYLASVIVHELAHQWFGNLVTPEWWTDLWLNEGFASYMEYIGVNAVEPTWRMMDMFVVMDLHSVFRLDCLESSHPINIPVRHPDEINEIFDRISYLKGSSIIRMMSNFLTEATFRRGLSKYLHGLAYKSAVQDDLWRYLTNQAHEDKTLAADVDVKTIMDTWTLQMGFPVVTVTKKKDGTAMLKQERFLLLRNESGVSTHDYKWWIPITYTTKQNPDFSTTSPRVWMMPTEETKIIDGMPSDGWVILNNNQTGYYRVNYDADNWQMIIDQLLKDHKVVSVVNRAQIIDDSMALARAGLLPYETAFKVLSYMKNEKDIVAWSAALSGMGFIESMMEHTGAYGALKQFMLSLILPMYNELGFTDSLTDPHIDQMLRARILSKACSLGHRPCIDESVKLFQAWMQDPDNYSLISPNLKPFVYCTAIAEGSYDEWKFAWNRYENSNVGTEKRILLSSLGCSRKSWILNGYLDIAIQDGKGIRKQDVSTVIGSVASSEYGRSLAWEYLKDKWTNIRDYFGSVSFTLGRIIKSCTGSLNTKNHLFELKQFVKMNDGKFGSAERSAKQAVENSQNNLNWMENNYKKILNWLTENGYSNSI